LNRVPKIVTPRQIVCLAAQLSPEVIISQDTSPEHKLSLVSA